jgi:hypothetical protein
MQPAHVPEPTFERDMSTSNCSPAGCARKTGLKADGHIIGGKGSSQIIDGSRVPLYCGQ